MIITYHGGEFFKVQFGDKILAFNPISKKSKLKTSRFGADVALVSINHPDMNGVDELGFGDRVPFAIMGPGEYEIKDVFIKGYPSESGYGGDKKINTVYSVSLEGMNLAFLGALKDGVKLSADILEALDDIDILFVPIGDEGVLGAADAYKLAVKLEPKIVIPMHYNMNGDKNSLKTFLKEAGEEGVKPIDKFTFKKKDIEGKEGEVVVLTES
ncbi:MAG TPA: MBL fold metallo-hydrolase [Candidatus Paceibacterota bacterium]